MRQLWIAIIIVLAVIWGIASISQSYAAAKQAEAVIEASRTAQITSTGNLIAIVLIALFVILLLVAIGVIAWLYYQLKIKPMLNQTQHTQARRTIQAAAPSANELLPQLMVMLMYQMTQQNRLPDPAQPLHQTDAGKSPVETVQDIWAR